MNYSQKKMRKQVAARYTDAEWTWLADQMEFQSLWTAPTARFEELVERADQLLQHRQAAAPRGSFRNPVMDNLTIAGAPR